MSTHVRSSYAGTPGATVYVEVRDHDTGTILVARATTGIREDRAGSGLFAYSRLLTDALAYELLYDEGGAVLGGDVFIPPAVTTGSPTISGDANGALLGLTFLIKRGDTLPYLRRQLVDSNGSIVALDGTETVKFTMRASTDVAMAGSAKVHSTATIIDGTIGLVEYQWQTGDTDTTTYSESSTLGRFTDTPYAAEFEVNYASGTVETFPQNSYIAVSIPPDLDPGVNP